MLSSQLLHRVEALHLERQGEESQEEHRLFQPRTQSRVSDSLPGQSHVIKVFKVDILNIFKVLKEKYVKIIPFGKCLK